MISEGNNRHLMFCEIFEVNNLNAPISCRQPACALWLSVDWKVECSNPLVPFKYIGVCVAETPFGNFHLFHRTNIYYNYYVFDK